MGNRNGATPPLEGARHRRRGPLPPPGCGHPAPCWLHAQGQAGRTSRSMHACRCCSTASATPSAEHPWACATASHLRAAQLRRRRASPDLCAHIPCCMTHNVAWLLALPLKAPSSSLPGTRCALACLPAAGLTTFVACWTAWAWRCITAWPRSCASTCRCAVAGRHGGLPAHGLLGRGCRASRPQAQAPSLLRVAPRPASLPALCQARPGWAAWLTGACPAWYASLQPPPAALAAPFGCP